MQSASHGSETKAPSEPPAETTQGKALSYANSIPGKLRISQALLTLTSIICLAVGYCPGNYAYYSFIMVITVITFVETCLVICGLAVRVQDQLKGINVPLTLLVNDSIQLFFYVLVAIMSMLQIGGCSSGTVARIFGMLFILGILFMLVGLTYHNYLAFMQWYEEKKAQTTVTNTSPTVLS